MRKQYFSSVHGYPSEREDRWLVDAAGLGGVTVDSAGPTHAHL